MSFKVWARRSDQNTPRVRARFKRAEDAEVLAVGLARASGTDGVMSVWVERAADGEVIWSAGEKAAEIVAPKGENDAN